MADLIERDRAIDALEKMKHDLLKNAFGKFYNTIIDTAIDRIKNLPSAQPEPCWIPCSERPPENSRQVLVFGGSVHYALAKYDEMRDCDGTYKKQWVTFDAWKPFYTIKNVLAWRELPEPYVGRRTG